MWECGNVGMWGFENVGIREAKMHRTKWKYDNAGIYAPAKKKDPEMAVAKREGIFVKQKVHLQCIIKKPERRVPSGFMFSGQGFESGI